MKIEVETPTSVSPEYLDKRLARGWFRSGSVLFRAPLLHLDEHLYELVHIRIRLDAEDNSRRRRRTLRQNRERFRIQVGPVRVDEASRRLYRLTQARFMGFVVSHLADIVLCDPPDLFDTRELRVYDGHRLIAISYFDLGRTSMAGVLGLRDPAYAKASLGTYTMLEEMAFGRRHGLKYYYPGYVAVGMPGFDYKYHLGDTQFFDGRDRWRPRVNPPTRSPLADHARDRMEELEAALRELELPFVRRLYPAFWLGRIDEVRGTYLRGMWHLCVRPNYRKVSNAIVEHITDDDLYVVARVSECSAPDPMELLDRNRALEAHCDTRLLAYDEIVLETRSAAEAASAALALL